MITRHGIGRYTILVAIAAMCICIAYSATPRKKKKNRRATRTEIVKPPSEPFEKVTEWVGEYIEQKSYSRDTADPLIRLLGYSKQLKGKYYSAFDKLLVDSLTANLKRNSNDRVIAVVELYDHLFADTAANKTKMLYVKGNILASKQDTIQLKKVIRRLNLLQDTVHSQTLYDHLIKIRNYVPADQGLDGTWISNRYMTDVYDWPAHPITFDYIGGQTIVYHKPYVLELENTCEYQPTDTSRLVLPYAEDSLYIVWSSEKLKNIDPEALGLLRGATSTAASIVSGNLARHNKVDLGEQILGNIATSAIEIGLNAIFDALWKPSKTVWILEGRFRRVNKYLLQGTLSYQSKKVNVDGKVSNKTSWTQEYSHTRYNPDDHIYWAGWRFGITTPYAWLTKYIDARKDQFIPAKKDKKHFNAHQRVKIWYLSHVRALEEGVDDDLYYQLCMAQADSMKQACYIAPFMGMIFASVDSIFLRKNKWSPEQGVVVKDFDKNWSAALLAGLKKNDVIVEVGPYPITDNASFSKAIGNFKPYEVVNVVVQRKKKRLTIPVELSAWLRPYDTKEEE